MYLKDWSCANAVLSMVSAPEKTTHQRMAEKHRGKWWRRRRWRSQRRRRIEHFPNRKLFEKFDNKPVFMGSRPARRLSISSSAVIPPTNILCVPLTSQPTERLLNDNHTTAESLLGSLVRWMRWKSFYLFGWLWRATFEGHVVEWGKLAWCVSLYPSVWSLRRWEEFIGWILCMPR